VLDGGGAVAADRVPVAGGLLRAEPAAYLLLGLRRPQVAFGLVGGGRDGGVGEEPQHVAFAVPQAFQQRPRWRLLALGAGYAADLGQADGDAAAEQLQIFGGAVCGDGCQAVITGQVRLVDQAAQGVGDLAGPDGLRVGLGGVFQVPQQVLGAELVADAVEGVVGWAAQRGPVFLPESGPFPGSLPPNSACTFQCTELSGDLCRVRDGVRVDPVMARRADDERLAAHSCH